MSEAGPTPESLWILTDGKAGDELPLTGLAQALGLEPQLRRVAPRRAFSLLMPYGPIDPREAEDEPGSPLAPPYPDICLATGRRAVAYLRRLKRLSPHTLTVFLKDPRIRRHGADLLVMQVHDRPADRDVFCTVTAPNRIDLSMLEALRADPPDDLRMLGHPRIAVLAGGDSRHHRFTKYDIERLVTGLEQRLAAGASLMMTTSRRTPAALTQRLANLESPGRAVLWNGAGANPLLAYLALADEVVVSADSTNMIGEAASTGKPLQIFHPSGGHPKINRLIEALGKIATIGRFPEAPATGDYEPVNATHDIARAIVNAWLLKSPPAPPSSPAGSSAWCARCRHARWPSAPR